jgi:hypothetical protein
MKCLFSNRFACSGKSVFLWLSGLLFFSSLQAQDSAWVRQRVQQLSAPEFRGRGYVQGGMDSAARYIAAALQQMGCAPVMQPFSMGVNAFPDSMRLVLNGSTLRPGIDYLVAAESQSFFGSAIMRPLYDSVPTFQSNNGLLVMREVPKLTWWVSTKQEPYTYLLMAPGLLPKTPFQATVAVQAAYLPAFNASNVMAMVPGTRRPDSMLVFCAHYDHLGQMGDEAVFAGANDNASGTALLLAWAKKLTQEPLPYTAVFLFFAAEEAGLLGSEYFVNHPLIPLDKIRFLVNLDLMGNGEEGITVVNATEHPSAFALLQQLNKQQGLIAEIYSRGKAKNSDHYYFSEKRVPSFFWYTMGARKAYHEVGDTAPSLPLYEVNDLLVLLRLFSESITSMPHQ